MEVNIMKKWLGIFLLFVALVTLSACNFGKKSEEAKDVENKKELNIAIPSDPPSFHPALATDLISGEILASVFEGLTRLDPEGNPEEAMAETIDVSDDGKTYTYHLRDAMWSNGDPVIADDFIYAWMYALNPENGANYAYQLYFIEGAEAYNTDEGTEGEVGVKAIDDQTLEVKLNGPTPFFNELTSFFTYYPVNSTYAEEHPDWYKNPGTESYIGNGPFVLSEFASSDHLTLAKNDDYWDKNNVALDQVNVQVIESSSTSLREFQAGNLDFLGGPFNGIDLNAVDQMREEGKLQTSDMAGLYLLSFNTNAEFIENENIRKALTIAIDREGLIKNVVKGEGKPAIGYVPPTMVGFEKSADYYQSNDIETAKAALDQGLKELGLTKPSDIKLDLAYNTSESHAAIMQFIQEGWTKNLGVEVSLSNSEWQVHLEKMQEGDYQVARGSWIADFNDPINFLEIYRTLGGNNRSGWTDETYTELIDKATVEQMKKLAQSYYRTQKLF